MSAKHYSSGSSAMMLLQVESVLCPGAFAAGNMGCIDPGGCEHDTPCSRCGFKQMWPQGLRPELVGNDGELKEGANPVWLKQVQWSRYKTEKDADGKQTMRGDRTGTVIEFLDELEQVYSKYVYHRYILHRTRASNTEFDRNATPGMLKLDVDWAENYTMLHAREIQSEYWLMKQVALFIGIGKLLSQEKWDATCGALKNGAEVSVQLEGSSFWAVVVAADADRAAEGAVYSVRDGSGALHQVQRRQLRARVWFTAAQAGVTNDKNHASYATQHFMDLFVDAWFQQHNIRSLHIHSDNAGSHFKNSRTLNYLSRLFERLGVKVTWSFGCPGHGKGPWAGFGGLLKRVLRRDTIDQNVVLKCFQAVADHLESRFCTEGWQENHGLESRHTVNKVSIFRTDSSEIDRRVNEVYASVEGIRKSFGYMALDGGRVLQRWFDCWCPECMCAGGPGKGSMNSNYQVAGCRCKERWYEHSVALQGTLGVAALKRKAQRRGRELASKLKPGTFIAVEDRGTSGDSNVPFLIGVTLDAGGGSCIVEQVTGNKRIEGTRFTAGDYAIKVKW